jgi:hypothetical protein
MSRAFRELNKSAELLPCMYVCMYVHVCVIEFHNHVHIELLSVFIHCLLQLCENILYIFKSALNYYFSTIIIYYT